MLTDLSIFDDPTVVADQAAIRRCNSQRYEMEQLTAVVYDDPVTNVIAGYKELTDREFWVHSQDLKSAVMPRSLICEAAAQLCSYHASIRQLSRGRPIGLGVFRRVKFRNQVHPCCRLDIVAKLMQAAPVLV